MTKNFIVQIVDCKTINEIPDAWSAVNYKALLGEIGLGEGLEDLNEKDIKDMCYMSLNELEPSEAAKVVLSYLFSDEELTEGKIEQLAHDLPEDKMWEQFSDLLCHHRLFNAYSLLRSAYNGIFPQPTGVQLTLKVIAKDSEDLTLFDHAAKASMVRLLAKGMAENVTLNRLYSDQIAGEEFPEAEGIIWLMEELTKDSLSREFFVTSSCFWLEDILELAEFEADIHVDEIDQDEQA